MIGKKPEGHGAQQQSRCQMGHFLGESSSSCAKPAKVNVDGLALCEGHAVEVKLEGQISCWEEILAHLDLWSREATRQNRPDIVGLMEVERRKATSAIARARSDLGLVRRESSGREASRGSGALIRRAYLPLDPGVAQPPSPELRHLRRR